MIHKTVLLKESIDNLNLSAGKIFFDGTLGGAGHSGLVCESFGGKVKVIGTDRDSGAIENAEQKLAELGCEYYLALSDYRNIDTVLANLKIQKVDAILIDLGL